MNNDGAKLLQRCTQLGLPISEIVLLDEMQETDVTREEVINRIKNIIEIMRNSVEICKVMNVSTIGGIIGGEAPRLNAYLQAGNTLCGKTLNSAMIKALACAQHNASMGCICASPTAGSSGIIPASLLTVYEEKELSMEALVSGLLTASGIGKIIMENATVSGAEGGCQAECGSAAAMAAAALVEMMGGSPEKSFNAAAIAIKNIMGLICDPIAGLVESPCSKRNASGTANAMISAELALAGISSVVCFDEVVEAMYNVGNALHSNFKETAKGGIAATKTGKAIATKIFG